MNPPNAAASRAPREWGLLALALCVSIPISWFVSAASWYTHGEVMSGGLAVITGLTHVFLIGLWIWKPKAGVSALLAFAVLCIASEGPAAIRLWKLQTEAQRLTHWINTETAKS